MKQENRTAKSPSRQAPNGLLLVYRLLETRFGPQYWWPGDTAFEMMVGAILTQNTNWGNVERAISNLKAARALAPRALAALPAAKLAPLIRPSGTLNIKAKRLHEFLRWFMARTKTGDVRKLRGVPTESLREELLNVKGVGPETADSILLYALHRPVFVVDAYTRRFLARHRMISPKASYDAIQKHFMDNLPRSVSLYNEYHALIVRLGKEVCRPTPRCDACPLRRPIGPPVLE